MSSLVAVASVAMLALYGLWHRDRSKNWDEPRWSAGEFVPLRAASLEGARELWLIPVNPRCPHCRGHLAHAAAALKRGAGARLGILLVDTPQPPAASAFASVAVDGLWWDARETWRRRWGHRVYGEVLVFDAAGRYMRTMPPGFDGAVPGLGAAP